MKNLMVLNQENKELRINSLELVDIINQFRKVESKTIDKPYKELLHKSFIAKIRNELETLKLLGLGGEQNILPSSYINSQNKEQPCYSLNRDGMLQMLNSESALVRFKTIEYINKLEDEINSKVKLPTTFKEALLMLVEAEEEKERLMLENKQKEQVILEYKPKVDYVDEILKSTDTLTISQIAKDYGMSGKELNSILAEYKVQYKQSGQWLLYSKYQSCGYTKSDTYKYTRQDGTIGTSLNTKWTQKGRLFINDLLKKIGIIAIIEREII